MSPISRRCWPRCGACWSPADARIHHRDHDGEGVVVADGLRYSHSAPCCARVRGRAGLALAQLEDLSRRNEDNTPAPGLVVVATS